MAIASHPLPPPAPSPAPARLAPLSVAASARCWNPMPTNEELNEWMEAVATAADRQAFAALFKHFAPRVKAYLMRSGSTPEIAEEVTQDAMVQVWRRASTFDRRKANATTWLFTIARNARIDHHRRLASNLDGNGEGLDVWEMDQPPADQALDPEEQALAAQRERSVHAALKQLPPDQALVLQLSFFEEHPHACIAQALGIPLGTVKSRIRLAVTQLRRKLEGLGP